MVRDGDTLSNSTRIWYTAGSEAGRHQTIRLFEIIEEQPPRAVLEIGRARGGHLVQMIKEREQNKLL